jgi:hypothetical protein
MSTQTVGFDLIQNISTLSKAHKPNENMDSFPICSNYQRGAAVPMDRIRLIGNLAYQPSDVSAWRPNARLISYRPGVVNRAAEVRNNYLMGANRALDVTQWREMNVSGNTMWGTEGLVQIQLPGEAKVSPSDLQGYTFDKNTYYAGAAAQPFNCQGKRSFAEWQGLGLDAHSRMLSSRNGRPTGTKVFVFRNSHQRGRGHVAVYNWDEQDKIAVDLSSILRKGDEYAVYNILDITHTVGAAKPVLTGRVAKIGPITLPMRRDPTSPHLDVFLLLPKR